MLKNDSGVETKIFGKRAIRTYKKEKIELKKDFKN